MASKARRRRFHTEVRDSLTVVTFLDPLLDEQNSWIIREQVVQLAEETGQWNLLLDFTNVKFLSSAALGALLKLNHKVAAHGGQLRLCHLDRPIEEVIRATQLDRIIDIHSANAPAGPEEIKP